jgi:hypothetical protein
MQLLAKKSPSGAAMKNFLVSLAGSGLLDMNYSNWLPDSS